MNEHTAVGKSDDNSGGTPNSTTNSIVQRCLAIWRGTPDIRYLQLFALAYTLLVYTRLPSSIPIIGKLYLQFFLGVVCLILFLPKARKIATPQTKLLFFFIAYNAAFIVVGRMVFDDLILNDGRAFAAWRALIQDYLFLFLPLAAFSAFGLGWKKLESLFVCIGVYLALYGVTHSGRGPGGFVGDENDLCLVIVSLFPFAIFSAIAQGSFMRRFAMATASLIMLAGIISTTSRGGFIGLLLTFAFLVWQSPKKVTLITGLLFICLLSLPFVPAKYWHEMGTIRQDTNKGTGQERLESWKIGLRMWLDPKNFVQGVGFSNGAWNIRYYEPKERGKTIKSLAGREFHSMHIQLVADNGLIGLILIGGLIYITYRNNNRIRKHSKRIMGQHRLIQNAIAKERRKLSDGESSQDRPLRATDNSNCEQILTAISSLDQSLHRWSTTANQLNVSMMAVLACGAFISFLYHPPLWIVLFLSATLNKTWRDIEATHQDILSLAVATGIGRDDDGLFQLDTLLL